jgi:ERCC4-related helicase
MTNNRCVACWTPAQLLTMPTQQEVFRKFHLGIHNLLIATKSIEDLDVPKATMVIRLVSLFTPTFYFV